jgi:CYTH domain-containing protein
MESSGEVEIERKYLLAGLPDLAVTLEVDQGWIPGERLRERVRRTRSMEGERYYRAIKLGSGLRRIEIEEETTAAIFDALWKLTTGKRVRKTRYKVPYEARIWEIDRFRDRELVLAEVELPDERADPRVPPWLAPHIVREVTEDPAYLNYNLAR